MNELDPNEDLDFAIRMRNRRGEGRCAWASTPETIAESLRHQIVEKLPELGDEEREKTLSEAMWSGDAGTVTMPGVAAQIAYRVSAVLAELKRLGAHQPRAQVDFEAQAVHLWWSRWNKRRVRLTFKNWGQRGLKVQAWAPRKKGSMRQLKMGTWGGDIAHDATPSFIAWRVQEAATSRKGPSGTKGRRGKRARERRGW